MLMPGLSDVKVDAKKRRWRGRAYQKYLAKEKLAQRRIEKAVEETLKLIEITFSILPYEPEISMFLTKLHVFLGEARFYNSYGLYLEEMAILIKNCVSIIQKRDAISILNLLNEHSIRQLYSMFDHRLYDILHGFQDYPWKRNVMIVQALYYLPNKITLLINQYEAYFSNSPLEYTNEAKQSTKLTGLFVETIRIVSSFLTPEERSCFVTSNKHMYGFLQPNRRLNALLRAVVSGYEEQVVGIVRNHPQLVLHRAQITDNSGRTFKKASAGELVWWYGDIERMANAMLDALMQLPKLEAIKILTGWLEQLQENEKNNGLTYTFPGNPELFQSLKFDITPLLNELQEYISVFDAISWDERDTFWRFRIGSAQFLLPAIYINHYCSYERWTETASLYKPYSIRSVEVLDHDTNYKHGFWVKEFLGMTPTGIQTIKCPPHGLTKVLYYGPSEGQVGGALACNATAAIAQRDFNELNAINTSMDFERSQFMEKLKNCILSLESASSFSIS